MRTVRDGDGRRLLLVKRSDGASLVRDPETGRCRYVPRDELTDAGGEAPLVAAAGGVPDPVRRVLSAVHDDRSLGLLVELVDRDAVAVRDLLADYELCESDLHGLLAEFVAAGLLAETTVAGERGYEPTPAAREAVDALRGVDAEAGTDDPDAGTDGSGAGNDDPDDPDRPDTGGGSDAGGGPTDADGEPTDAGGELTGGGSG